MRFVLRRLASNRVEEVDHLSANIGYLKVSGFPPACLMTEKYAAAMDELADTDGLIVDLRHNRGGDPKSVALMISLFRRPAYTPQRHLGSRNRIATQYWTADKLDGTVASN